MKTTINLRSGFTLIEMLVTVTVIGIVSVAAIQPIGSLLTNFQSFTSRTASIQNISTILQFIKQDFDNANQVLSLSNSTTEVGYLQYQKRDGSICQFTVNGSNTLRFVLSSGGSTISDTSLAVDVQKFKITAYKYQSAHGDADIVNSGTEPYDLDVIGAVKILLQTTNGYQESIIYLDQNTNTTGSVEDGGTTLGDITLGEFDEQVTDWEDGTVNNDNSAIVHSGGDTELKPNHPQASYEFWVNSQIGTDTIYTAGCETEPFATIKYAIDQAKAAGIPGTLVINVAPGDYNEFGIIDLGSINNLQLNGAGRTATKITLHNSLQSNNANWISIKNLGFDTKGMPVNFSLNDHLIINNCIFTGSAVGNPLVAISNSSFTSISECIFYNYGIGGNTATALEIKDSSDTDVTDCTFMNINGHAAWLENLTRVQFVNNTVDSCSAIDGAVYLNNGNDANVQSNWFINNNSRGLILIANAWTSTIQKNVFQGNYQAMRLELAGSPVIDIKHNYFNSSVDRDIDIDSKDNDIINIVNNNFEAGKANGSSTKQAIVYTVKGISGASQQKINIFNNLLRYYSEYAVYMTNDNGITVASDRYKIINNHFEDVAAAIYGFQINPKVHNNFIKINNKIINSIDTAITYVAPNGGFTFPINDEPYFNVLNNFFMEQDLLGKTGLTISAAGYLKFIGYNGIFTYFDTTLSHRNNFPYNYNQVMVNNADNYYPALSANKAFSGQSFSDYFLPGLSSFTVPPNPAVLMKTSRMIDQGNNSVAGNDVLINGGQGGVNFTDIGLYGGQNASMEVGVMKATPDRDIIIDVNIPAAHETYLNGTYQYPYSTPIDAVKAANSGDRVILLSGQHLFTDVVNVDNRSLHIVGLLGSSSTELISNSVNNPFINGADTYSLSLEGLEIDCQSARSALAITSTGTGTPAEPLNLSIINCIIHNSLNTYPAVYIKSPALGGSITIKRSDFNNNSATLLSGGALFIWDNEHELSVSILRSIFKDNSSLNNGGGGIYLYQQNGKTNTNISYSLFDSNSAKGLGGAISIVGSGTSIFNRCYLFSNKTENSHGGAINNNYGAITLVNCTLYNNNSLGTGGGLYSPNNNDVTIYNCILWNNGQSDYPDDIQVGGSASNLKIVSSIISEEGYWLDADNNSADDPLLNDDGSLSQESPAIESGADDNPQPTDIVGWHYDRGMWESPCYQGSFSSYRIFLPEDRVTVLREIFVDIKKIQNNSGIFVDISLDNDNWYQQYANVNNVADRFDIQDNTATFGFILTTDTTKFYYRVRLRGDYGLSEAASRLPILDRIQLRYALFE